MRTTMAMALLLVTACSSARTDHPDAGQRDAGEVDAGPVDAGTAGPQDAGPPDAGCAAGSHQCEDSCYLDTDVNACGSSCTPCPTTPNGTPTCDGTSCGQQCDVDAGAHLCDGMCPYDNTMSCGPSCVACTASPPNAFPVCISEQCTVACSGNYIQCPNNPSACGNLAGGAMSTCTANDDCCSGQCQITSGDEGQCCNLIGSPCMDDDQCGMDYQCKSLGTSVQMDCSDAGLCCLPGGQSCSQNSDCCSNECGLANFCD